VFVFSATMSGGGSCVWWVWKSG